MTKLASTKRVFFDTFHRIFFTLATVTTSSAPTSTSPSTWTACPQTLFCQESNIGHLHSIRYIAQKQPPLPPTFYRDFFLSSKTTRTTFDCHTTPNCDTS
ncbi:hypothetical protein GQ43DRAFT_260164 [Delitschia confertaspora ATCC 74209]|uniref:Uncharacterized protein n=1 Tax=Delitschia confertaspora ATCC 74209 TaxID=1513339 RepID=A0A9P4JPS9_9PLEO|nr:hypothetical protein GQ43DRAFT_260164 [Delitschia confertaspora ATCC 74209]